MAARTYSLESTPNDRFFEKLFMEIFIHFQSFCQKSAESKSPKKYILYFVLMSGLGLEPWPTHYLLEHGNYINISLEFCGWLGSSVRD